MRRRLGDDTQMLGKSVEVCNVPSRADLDGKVGRVLSFDEAKGEYTVLVEGARVLVDRANLKQLDLGVLAFDAVYIKKVRI